ncbi:hypothetical protein ACEE23_04240 [Corynebacterium sp. 32222D000AT]|uniref:hypothetical protein n=1 Tax=unclassified Corynebacterium TaxID=2624378 RepID=UPI002A94813B|nr:hypothetical protein [Mycobacteriaceae bacterium]MDY5829175.1 hypothetical protein [Corynebacterium sp.]
MSTNREYQMDYDWLWDNPPHNDGTPATVRLVVTDGERDSAQAALAAFLDSLERTEDGAYVSGGWVAAVRSQEPLTVDITSGGEDVADGIQDGTERAYEYFGRGTDLGLRWTQLPRL